MSFDDRRRHAEQTLCLVAEKSGAADHVFEPRHLSARKLTSGWKLMKECRGHEIHSLVRALRTEDRCDEELKGSLEVELGASVRILSLESRQHVEGMS